MGDATKTRKQLIEQLNVFRTVIDSLRDPIYAKDREGRFVLANVAQVRYMGAATADEVIGKSDSDFYPPELASQYYADEQAVIQSGHSLTGHEEPRTDRQTGEQMWTSTTRAPVLDSRGRAVGIVGIGRDITELKRAQAALERRAVQLQTAAEVSRTASAILDPDELIQRAVDLARERFGLYYAGLFLVDETGEWTGEPGKWAVLRAGTGEAGRQMLEQKHRLEIGGASMIGWCVANKQARIVLDVGEEAKRFDNPLLPKTRSEMALPLVSRGEAMGALTIQSAQPAAFSEEDIAVLQTMADQLANAIANAHFYDYTQREIAERKRAEAALKQAYAEVEKRVEERTAELRWEVAERERAQGESARLQQEVIEAQQRAIQELSMPIIPVLEGVIVMPLIGSIDTLRARDITRQLLAGIREHRAKVVILDITGVPIVDSGVASYLNKTIQAARLKGARTIVTGVSDAVAETIVDLGIDWSGVETLSDLRTGLQMALTAMRPQA